MNQNNSLIAVERITHCWISMCDTRREIGDSWKWPNPLDCVRFAFQELAEADDELIRANAEVEYLRRRDETNNSFVDEIGMCIVMLLSAFAANQPQTMSYSLSKAIDQFSSRVNGMSDVAVKISNAWNYYESGSNYESFRVEVMLAVVYIYIVIGDEAFVDAVHRALKKATDRAEYKKSKKYLYLKNRGIGCPECLSIDISSRGRPDFDDNWVSRQAKCDSCGYQWIDVYELIDMKDDPQSEIK